MSRHMPCLLRCALHQRRRGHYVRGIKFAARTQRLKITPKSFGPTVLRGIPPLIIPREHQRATNTMGLRQSHNLPDFFLESESSSTRTFFFGESLSTCGLRQTPCRKFWKVRALVHGLHQVTIQSTFETKATTISCIMDPIPQPLFRSPRSCSTRGLPAHTEGNC